MKSNLSWDYMSQASGRGLRSESLVWKWTQQMKMDTAGKVNSLERCLSVSFYRMKDTSF